MFLTTADFVGKYKLAKDTYSKDLLDSYIEKYEKIYLQDLLGCELYDAFIADLNTDTPPAPLSQRFIDIYEERCINDVCGIMYRSDGILDMLKGFIYYHYILDQKFKSTIIGTVVNEGSFSREIGAAKSTMEDRYNSAVDSYISIQLFILDNEDIYPEYKGIKKRKSFFGGSF